MQETNFEILGNSRDRREFATKLFLSFQKWSGKGFKDTCCFTLLEEVKKAQEIAAAYKITGNQPSDLPERVIAALSLDIVAGFSKMMREPQSLVDPSIHLLGLYAMAEMLTVLSQNIELSPDQKVLINKVFDKHYKILKRIDGWLTY